VFLFYGFTPGKFNEELITLILTLAALDKADCRRVTLVLPFFPYTRQDRKDEGRVPLSARAVIDMLCLSSSFERIITMDIHSEQLESAFARKVKMDHLPGSLLVSPWIKKAYAKKLADLVVVAPDNGSAKRAKKLASLIAPGTPIAIFDKERDKDGTKLGDIIGAPVAGKICILNDDMIDTGGTIADAAVTLKALGAKEVIISATHAIFSSKKGVSAYDTLAKAGAQVVVTDSLPTEVNSWLTVIPIGKLVGNVMFENLTPDGSVSRIINGEVK
jgi:ribose-phosphate pyrophosphokinase